MEEKETKVMKGQTMEFKKLPKHGGFFKVWKEICAGRGY